MRSREIAGAAGVTVKTLRHYHRIGLLPEPPRSENGYRDYRGEDLVLLLRIRGRADLGVPLGGISQMIGGGGGALGGAAALYGCCACLSVLGVSVWAQLRLFAGAAYRPRLLVFSRAVHLVLLQLLVRVCAQLLPGSVTACSTLAARVLPVFRLPPDAAAAGFVFLCAALYKARQSLYNNK